MSLGGENEIVVGGGKNPVKLKFYNLLLAFLILFLGVISFSFFTKAEAEYDRESEVSFVSEFGDLSGLCEKAKSKFFENENFVAKYKDCSMIDCYCDNIVYANVLSLIVDDCYKKLELYTKGN